jgi:hypothetical protein
MKTENNNLEIIRSVTMGEMRHRVVKRRRDMTYWCVSEHRDEQGKWLPMTVSNQNGTQAAAERLFQDTMNPPQSFS